MLLADPKSAPMVLLPLTGVAANEFVMVFPDAVATSAPMRLELPEAAWSAMLPAP
ncbi:MAG TPA: hypothetical protein VFT53_03335 [Candidatus Saccharimonadales bacterium]|nr:hypothetical protein [Candidatus Saccharimonadales bacterium]